VGAKNKEIQCPTNPLSAASAETDIDWEAETDISEDMVRQKDAKSRDLSSSGQTILLTGTTELMDRKDRIGFRGG
jgi:hypothetical protein